MFITNPEYDFWPWTWYHDQKECKSIEDLITAWKTIQPGNDPVFDPRRHQHRNSAGQKKITDIAKNIKCHTHDVDTTDKIQLVDYKVYALEKFDQQMQKIVNKHKKVAVGLSGGIDSTMTLSWLKKNKVDFESFVVRGDPWRGDLNKITESNAIEMSKSLGVTNHVIDFNETSYDKHALIRQYCEADKYDMPCISLMTQPPASMYLREKTFDSMIVAPVGTDDLFLHRANSWCRFIPEKMLQICKTFNMPLDYITDYGYKMGGFAPSWLDKMDWNSGIQTMHGWEDDLLFQMHKGRICSPATSQEWYEMWHKIDDESCDNTQLQDIMGVRWLKKQIAEWVGDDIVDLVKGVPCTENYYKPNGENRKYILSECNRWMDYYKQNKNPTQQLYWKSIIDVIKMWNKVSPDVVQGIHTLNWLRKQR